MKSEIYTVIDKYGEVLASYKHEQDAINLAEQHYGSYVHKNTLYTNTYKYTAIDEDGTVVAYSVKPVIDEMNYSWMLEDEGEYEVLYTLPDSNYNWKDSLVEINND